MQGVRAHPAYAPLVHAVVLRYIWAQWSLGPRRPCQAAGGWCTSPV